MIEAADNSEGRVEPYGAPLLDAGSETDGEDTDSSSSDADTGGQPTDVPEYGISMDTEKSTDDRPVLVYGIAMEEDPIPDAED